jgi:hypothetical protein
MPRASVHLQDTSSAMIPNASPTAAVGSDLYGMATLAACEQFIARLAPYRARLGAAAAMQQLAHAAWLDRVSLSAQGFYKTPVSGYNFETGEGEGTPFTVLLLHGVGRRVARRARHADRVGFHSLNASASSSNPADTVPFFLFRNSPKSRIEPLPFDSLVGAAAAADAVAGAALAAAAAAAAAGLSPLLTNAETRRLPWWRSAERVPSAPSLCRPAPCAARPPPTAPLLSGPLP